MISPSDTMDLAQARRVQACRD